jgi:hypothetical protein
LTDGLLIPAAAFGQKEIRSLFLLPLAVLEALKLYLGPELNGGASIVHLERSRLLKIAHEDGFSDSVGMSGVSAGGRQGSDQQ